MNKEAFHFYLFQGESLIRKSDDQSISGWIICLPGKLSSLESELLDKILQAVNADPKRLHKIDFETGTFSWENIKSATLLAFGATLPQCEDRSYEVISKATNRYILADSLHVLNDSVELKQKLWKALKRLS